MHEDGDHEDAREDAVDELREANAAQHVQTRADIMNHMDSALEARFGPALPAVSDDYDTAMASFRLQEDKVKLQRSAFKLLHKQRQQEEKKQTAKRARAASMGSKAAGS